MAAASDSFMAGSSMMDKDMEMEAEVVGEEEVCVLLYFCVNHKTASVR